MPRRLLIVAFTLSLLACDDHHGHHHHIPPEVERAAQNTVFPMALGQADYGPANWIKSPNYTTAYRGKGKISTVVVHTVQGSYNGCISWFKNPAAKVSAHYVISKTGKVTQMVKEKDIAWHVASQNGYTIGIEHEGWVDDPKWATPAMVTASAKLTCYLVKKYGLSATKTHIKGHVELPKQTHTDPGKYWPWQSYLQQVASCVGGGNSSGGSSSGGSSSGGTSGGTSGGSSGGGSSGGGTCPKSCDDGNTCTNDACVSGVCKYSYANGKVCWDGDACTAGEKCDKGKCVGGSIVKNCDDNNPCTLDGCSAGKCTHKNKAVSCDDGDPCTTGDVCKSGSCAGGSKKKCNDGNPCTEDACVGGQCVTGPKFNACEDGDLCTVGDKCDGSKCVSGPKKKCDDGDPCTVGDVCDGSSGVCSPGLWTDCDAQGVCVTGKCDAATGGCLPVNDGATCDDDDPCTANTTCKLGKCQGGSAVSCDDGNPCTHDSCNFTGCLHLPHAYDCDDGEACTLADTCVSGVCVGKAISCDDGDPCTKGQTCKGGQCSAGELICDDGNACTEDLCDAGVCSHQAQVVDCDDGDLCSQKSYCQDQACVGGVPVDCDDDDPCTFDRCVQDVGCQHDITDCGGASSPAPPAASKVASGVGGCAASPAQPASWPAAALVLLSLAALLARRHRRT